ncbi:MAG: amidohydrolase [Acidobacteria bacterium]|nr:amidohydrolase [Acidobacteriota bacterium]
MAHGLRPIALSSLVLMFFLGGAATAPHQKRRVSLVISGGVVVTVDRDRRILDPGSIAVDGDRIVAVDRPEMIANTFEAHESIDARGRAVMPGLINTHTHAPMVLYRGLADDLSLMEWLQKYIFPAEAKTVSPEFVRAGTRLAALEMIRSGTTTYADMYYFEEEVAAATKNAGLRAVLGQTIVQFPAPDAKSPADGLNRAEQFIQTWQRDDLISPAVAPHSMYTLDRRALLACRDLGVRYGVPVLIHLAETRDELRLSRKAHRASPTAYLESIDFWRPRTVAAHGVWVSQPDIAILKRRGVGVSHNPESNMKLASGIAPVVQLRGAGVPVGLGTDGAASNNDLDMFEAMRQASFLAKLDTRNPRTLSASEAIAMATIEGARALGMDRDLGSLEPGKKADVILVSLAAARQTPVYHVVSHLVYVTRGDDVQTTIVNGRIVMREGKVQTLQEARVLAEARTMADRVRAAVR